MLTLIYGIATLAMSFVMSLFGFFVGRCARKLPVIDDKLPWAIHRGRWPVRLGPDATGAQSKWRALG
jgi:hypothetical protein